MVDLCRFLVKGREDRDNFCFDAKDKNLRLPKLRIRRSGIGSHQHLLMLSFCFNTVESQMHRVSVGVGASVFCVEKMALIVQVCRNRATCKLDA